MIRIALCDDKKVFIDMIKEMLIDICKTRNKEKICISEFLTAEELMMEIEDNQEFNIIFMDIEFGNSNGIEVAESINEKNGNTQFIFVSSHMEYVLQTFKVVPVGFIHKPFGRQEIKECYERAIKNMGFNDYISIEYNRQFVPVKLNDIQYIRSYKRQTYFYCDDGRIYVSYEKLDTYEKILSKHKEFIRIHKSYIVNFAYVKTYSMSKVVLNNNIELGISRKNTEIVKKKYFEFVI